MAPPGLFCTLRCPRVSVRPEIDTGKSSLGIVQASVTSSKAEKTRFSRPPSTVILSLPGPWIVTASLMGIWPEVRLIVPVRPGWKATVCGPGVKLACTTAARRLPSPESLRLVTVNVAGGGIGLPDSYAPMSAAAPTTRAKPVPR